MQEFSYLVTVEVLVSVEEEAGVDKVRRPG